MYSKAFLIFWTVFCFSVYVVPHPYDPKPSEIVFGISVFLNIIMWAVVATPVAVIGLLWKNDKASSKHQEAIYVASGVAGLVICFLVYNPGIFTPHRINTSRVAHQVQTPRAPVTIDDNLIAACNQIRGSFDYRTGLCTKR
jgi:hypothetical protein